MNVKSPILMSLFALGLVTQLRAQTQADDAPTAPVRQQTSRGEPGLAGPGVSLPALGDLPAGKSLTIVYRVSVDAGPFAAGKNDLSDQAQISGANFTTVPTNDPDTAAPNDPTRTTLDALPDFSLSASDGGISTTPGSTVTYVLSYSNGGSQNATGVSLATTVPANTTFNPGASTAGWSCTPNNNAGSACTLTIGSLAGGGVTGGANYAVTVVNPVAAGVAQISVSATIADDGLNGADPTPANNVGTDTTPLDAAPDLTLSKTDSGASVNAGGTVTYTLGYANAGNQGATGVTLTETVPANTTFNPGASTAGWSCTPNNNAGSTCLLTIGGLSGGGVSGSAAFAVTLPATLPAGVNDISNTASTADDGTNGPDAAPGNNTASDTTPVNAAPDLTLVKSDGGASVTAGGTITYTLTLSNAGTQGATGVTLTETVPANTTFNAGASTPGWVCVPDNNPGSTCTLTVGALGAPGSNAPTFAVTVAATIPAGVTVISNTASTTDDGTNGPDGTPGNNTGNDTTPIVAAPDLNVAVSDAGASTTPGATLSYTISYGNTGTRGASGVVLTETVPANTTFNPGASTAGWSCTPDNNPGSTCTLTIGGLAAAVNGSATYALSVDNPVPAGVSQISTTAAIADDGANGADPTPANNTASDTTPLNAEPDLALTKGDGGATATPGSTVSYSLGYSNIGNQGATGVALTETVPANTTFNAGASSPGWTCVPDNNAGSTCTLTVAGALAGGGGAGAAVFAVTVASPLPAGVDQVSNTANVADDTTNGPEPNTGNNTSSDTTPITAAPDFNITKSDEGASTSPGGTVAYTLNYGNTGDQGGSGVELTETVPAHTTFNAGASTAGWTCVPDNNAGSTCTLTIGGLAAGNNGTATFAVTVNASVPAGVTQIDNTAEIVDDEANGPDGTPANNTSSDSTPLTAAPNLRVLVDDQRVAVLAGQTLAYNVSVDNIGTQDATGVVLTETVPALTTFSAAASTPGWSCTPDDNPGATCTFNVAGAVAVGAAPQTAVFAVVLGNPVTPGGSVSNTASGADDGSNGPDTNPADNTGSDSTLISTKGDANSSGQADIIFQNTTSGRVVSWFMNAQNRVGGGATSPIEFSVPGYKVVGSADFNDDGQNDLLWRNPADGAIRVWLMNAMLVTSEVSTTPAQEADTTWEIVATGDLNADNKPDILFRNSVTGAIKVWLMNGLTRLAEQSTSPVTPGDLGWRVVGIGDFNHVALTSPVVPADTFDDLVFRNQVTGKIVIWLMNGVTRINGAFANPSSAGDSNWEIAAVADYNGDNQSDLLWRNTTSGRFVMWFMNGLDRTAGTFTNPPEVLGSPSEGGLAWRIVGPK
jgi:uncharacterized repeat protein (TIGR01451 family)